MVNDSRGGEDLKTNTSCTFVEIPVFSLLTEITLTEEDPSEHPRSHQPKFKPAFAGRSFSQL